MKQSNSFSMQVLPPSELMPVVAQVINKPQMDALNWQVEPVSGSGGGGASGMVGLYRLRGSAQVGRQKYPWSVVVKVFNSGGISGIGADTFNNPSAWNYWKRELLAYSSGLLNELDGNLAAPRCYRVTEHSQDEWWLWLEDITETPPTWSLEQYGLAARHLGQFNGSYLTRRALPAEQPWFYRGRAREWLKTAEAMFAGLQQHAASPLGQRWLSPKSVARMEKLLLNCQDLLSVLDKLPVCLCHHDTFRRNLLARDQAGGGTQTVAIDWSMLGYGAVGQEIGITTGTTLFWMEAPGDQAMTMDQAIFESYVAGLRDMGWSGDSRLARFGYTTTASLVTGLCWATFMGAGALSNEAGIKGIEQTLGFKLDDILAQWAVVHPLSLDLGDEALQLMDELN